MPDDTLNLLSRLVATDSVNPGLVPGGAGEAKIAQIIATEMRSFGMEVQVTDAAHHRPNVVGALEGKAPGRTLMFCGHTDTVGVAGMKAPFDPVVRDGRLYGRGSQDMKGGVAAMIGAARKLAATGGLRAGKLVIAAVADEEHASLGARELVKGWQADGAVIPEPTDLQIGLGHRGFSWLEVTTRGVAAHGSRPRDGRDAIFRMARVLGKLEDLDRELQARPPHPIQGTASLHASLISGGRELSSYPDHCVLEFERRTTSDEPNGIALRQINQFLAELKERDREFEGSAKLMLEQSPFEIPCDHGLVVALGAAISRAGRTPKHGPVSFWTDAAILASAGIPTVVFGPGGAGLHSPEEFVYVDDVLACRDVLADLASRFCAG
jgi:acetylornithine deacetylase